MDFKSSGGQFECLNHLFINWSGFGTGLWPWDFCHCLTFISWWPRISFLPLFPEPEAFTIPENLLEMKILHPHPRLTGVDVQQSEILKLSRWLWCRLQFEMHFSRDSRKTEYPNKLKHLPWMTVFVLILLNSHFIIKSKGQPYTKKKRKT